MSKVVRVLKGGNEVVAVGADQMFAVGLVRGGVSGTRSVFSELHLESAGAVIDVGSELAQISDRGLAERTVVASVEYLPR